MTSRQRLLLGSIFGGGSLFIAMKWKAVMQRSEAAKVAGARENYFVVPGRSGKLRYLLLNIIWRWFTVY
ncbi:hypothetical protein CJF31_00010567 [Rutstroemia sp. NJR-2017a BVV2]|nr:hypothetical protein CJF31_00010567 [Rutstroemia sp. NJR-2017a BVV2]